MELSMRSRKELTDVIAREYRTADRAAKGLILQQLCHSTGYNRAYAALLLGGYAKRTLVSGASEVIRLRRICAARPEIDSERRCNYEEGICILAGAT
jgi:hypothetical protein